MAPTQLDGISAADPFKPVRVVLADDHDLVRSGIKALLTMIEGVEVIAEARDGGELLALLADMKPDVVITDISMPGMDGITTMAEIRDKFPEIKVLVVSMHDTVDFVKRAMANGACGYLLKDASPFELEKALRSVMTMGSYFSPAIAQRLMQPAEPTAADELTHRQVQILTLIAQGRASREIAFELGLKSKTVDVHRARMMDRLTGEVVNKAKNPRAPWRSLRPATAPPYLRISTPAVLAAFIQSAQNINDVYAELGD